MGFVVLHACHSYKSQSSIKIGLLCKDLMNPGMNAEFFVAWAQVALKSTGLASQWTSLGLDCKCNFHANELLRCLHLYIFIQYSQNQSGCWGPWAKDLHCPPLLIPWWPLGHQLYHQYRRFKWSASDGPRPSISAWSISDTPLDNVLRQK